MRFLSNKRSGPLSWHDLENAKEVFGRKCLVGLLDEAEESLKRFERFFHWQERVSDPAIKDRCISQYLTNGDRRKEHPTYEGTQAWETLRKKNEYDVLLFEYAKNLFTQQSAVYNKWVIQSFAIWNFSVSDASVCDLRELQRSYDHLTMPTNYDQWRGM